MFGTSSISSVVDQIKDQELEYATTPKSVSGMTSLYLPNITRDFPEFHYDEMRERAEHLLVSYLMSINKRMDVLTDSANSDLKKQLEQYLQSLDAQDKEEHYTSIKTHESAITRYSKEKGICKITFQISAEHYHYVTRDGIVIQGKDDRLEQSRYNVDLIYIQDRDIVENSASDVKGLNCPNCGAPVRSIGQKRCEYCGTAIIEYNINVWTFSDVRED